jgi:hypothetical protein
LAGSLRRCISLPDAFSMETGAPRHNRLDGTNDTSGISKKEGAEMKFDPRDAD